MHATNALTQAIVVTPDTIDFGSVRVGTLRDSLFSIEDTGSANLTLFNTTYSDFTTNTEFSADNLSTFNYTLGPGSAVPVRVHFVPFTDGPHIARILIASDDPEHKLDTVVLLGIGVRSNVVSNGHDFGLVRVGRSLPAVDLPIVNSGSESSLLIGVEILNPSQSIHFTTSIDTFPPIARKPIQLNPGSTHDIRVAFNPLSLGPKQLLIQVTTMSLDGRDTLSLVDTIRGTGVEPLVTVSPGTIDFGTITVRKLSDPNPSPLQMDSSFMVSNIGTMPGQLLKLLHTDSAHFRISLSGQPDISQTLPGGGSLAGVVTFLINEEGDFTDTVHILNDTRYSLYKNSPFVYDTTLILRAKVRTGPIDTASVSFDTITNCQPIDSDIVFHNPYPVEIHIDSLSFTNGIDTLILRSADTNLLIGGFTLAGPQFSFPINIPPDANYSLHLRYTFPDDSLNGSEFLSIILHQRRGGGLPSLQRIVTASVSRKDRVLTLKALLPKFETSATDIVPLKLPITIEGKRDDVPELDDWTLDLTFSNDLFQPDSVSTVGALARPKQPNGTPLTWSWNQSTRTFSIVAVGVDVSNQQLLANKLLLTVLMHAYLTKDTMVTVTPKFTFARHPCAYILEPFTLAIPYADECGEQTIRNYMRGNLPTVNNIVIRPNPVTPSTEGTTIAFNSERDQLIIATVRDVSGRSTGEYRRSVQKGAITFSLPQELIPASGTWFVTLEARGLSGGEVFMRSTSKLVVQK